MVCKTRPEPPFDISLKLSNTSFNCRGYFGIQGNRHLLKVT
jgi:hypothetical protein